MDAVPPAVADHRRDVQQAALAALSPAGVAASSDTSGNSDSEAAGPDTDEPDSDVEVVEPPLRQQGARSYIESTIRHANCLLVMGNDTATFMHGMCPACAGVQKEPDFKARVLKQPTAAALAHKTANMR
jgi:hypothetical protein